MNTYVLFFFGIVLGVLVTMSFVSRMAGDGSILSASVADDHEQKHKKLNHQFTHKFNQEQPTTTSATPTTAIGTGAAALTSAIVSNFRVNADVDRWADEVMDVIGLNAAQSGSGTAAVSSLTSSRAIAGGGSGSSTMEPRATQASDLDLSKPAKKKSPVSPLDALAKDIQYVPDTVSARPKSRQREREQQRHEADIRVIADKARLEREKQASIRASGNAEKERIEAREREAQQRFDTAAQSGKASSSSSSSSSSTASERGVSPAGAAVLNFDTKTDLRGRDSNDDLIIGAAKSSDASASSSNSSAGSRSKTSAASSAASTALVKYHGAARLPPRPVNVMSVESLVSAGRALPDMSRQYAEFEKEDLKLHLCNAVFEAYSASYLTTKKHIMDVKSESYNLTWVNCEMASFIHMRESKNFVVNPMGDGMIIQSLDVLDFSVIHLSAFERSSKKHKHLLWKERKDLQTAWHNIDPVKETAKILDNLNNPKNPKSTKIVHSEEAKRTVVVMPFLGGAMGAGHSELGNRFEYLKACFWSFYEFVPNIVAGVTRQADVDWIMKESGMPFYDVILLENLPKSAGLPVGTTQQVKQRLVSGQWDFDYVFFTESDQILISRELQLMFNHLKKYPDRMLLPHRLMPYSDRAMKEVHKRNLDAITKRPTGDALVDNQKGLAIGANDWQKQSCCMERQNCKERKTWKHVSDPEVPIINYHGLFVPLGNINFLAESYRFCRMSPYTDICP